MSRNILILATNNDFILGLRDKRTGKYGLPWVDNNNKNNEFSEDLARFKEITLDNIIVMGKNTYQSIIDNNSGRLLKQRRNIIISSEINKKKYSRNILYKILGNKYKFLEVYSSYYECMNKLRRERLDDDIYFIGGGQLYKKAYKFADSIDISIINHNIDNNIYDLYDIIDLPNVIKRLIIEGENDDFILSREFINKNNSKIKHCIYERKNRIK